MAATANDIKLFQSVGMNDLTTGGGRASAALVQNGMENNVFPDVSAADRVSGAVRLRKVFARITNADLAPLLGASVVIDAVPTDPAVDVVIFKAGDHKTTREQALELLRDQQTATQFSGATYNDTSCTATSASAVVTGSSLDSTGASGVGAHYLITQPPVGAVPSVGHPELTIPPGTKAEVRRLLSDVAGSLTFDQALPFGGVVGVYRMSGFPNAAGVRCYGAAKTSAIVSTGATAVPMVRVVAQVAGHGGATAARAGVSGFGVMREAPNLPDLGVNYAGSAGYVPFVLGGDMVTLWHEDAIAPAVATNGGTLNAGRVNLDQLAVVGNNGIEIARFLANGPTVSAGCTADLAAGTVTFSNVTGYSQPVTVKHRIAHRSSVAGINANVVLADAVTRDFPSGSVLSSHLPLGDMQASLGVVFAQQAWTRVWSDALIGNSAPFQLDGDILVTNQGAEDDRYALVFGTGNDFTCYSERYGQIGVGLTTASFAPVNPATGAPLFTIPSTAFGTGILVGSVLRFNTVAAAAPVWELRSVRPSTASGLTGTALRVFGSVNA